MKLDENTGTYFDEELENQDTNTYEDDYMMDIGDQMHDDYMYVQALIEEYMPEYKDKLTKNNSIQYTNTLVEFAERVYNDAPVLGIEMIKNLIEIELEDNQN